MESKRKNSAEQLDDVLYQLASLIVADTRLGDHLPDGVISRLVEFLDDKQDSDKKTYRFQYHSTLVLANVVCSNKGVEVMKLAVPSLFKLIPSPIKNVQILVLVTLTAIAREFPQYCNTMVQKGVFEHLEPLITDDFTNYVVLKSGGELLVPFCLVNPSLPPDQIKKIVDIICIALHHEYEANLIPISLALSILSEQKQVVIGTEFARLHFLIRLVDLM